MKILKQNDLQEIASFLIEKGYDQSDITILIDVKTKQMLNRISDDYFYRNAVDKSEEPPTDNEEININIGEVKFKYVYSEKEVSE